MDGTSRQTTSACSPSVAPSQVLAFAMDLSGASAPGDTATLSIADPFAGSAPSACEATWPGAFAWEPVTVPVPATGSRWLFGALPLVRGALLVRCSGP